MPRFAKRCEQLGRIEGHYSLDLECKEPYTFDDKLKEKEGRCCFDAEKGRQRVTTAIGRRVWKATHAL
jgi:hypothetical protein